MPASTVSANLVREFLSKMRRRRAICQRISVSSTTMAAALYLKGSSPKWSHETSNGGAISYKISRHGTIGFEPSKRHLGGAELLVPGFTGTNSLPYGSFEICAASVVQNSKQSSRL